MKVTGIAIVPPPAAADLPKVTPELLASVLARYSRSNESLDKILGKVDLANPDESIDRILKFVGYGHASIGGLTGGLAVALDNVSMWLADKIFEIAQMADGGRAVMRRHDLRARDPRHHAAHLVEKMVGTRAFDQAAQREKRRLLAHASLLPPPTRSVPASGGVFQRLLNAVTGLASVAGALRFQAEFARALSRRQFWRGATALFGMALAGTASLAEDQADPELVAEIARIRIIDNHCHNDAADPQRGTNWNNEAPLGVPRYPDVVPLRRDHSDWIRAWRVLYGYRFEDMQPEHVRALLETKRRLMREKGDDWPRFILDQAGIDVALVNAVELGAGQKNERFRWVPYADPLLWPFSGEKSHLLFSGGDCSNARLQREAGVKVLPATLDAYVAQVVEPTLARWATGGALAVKFLSAYTRSLAFELVEPELAASLYARGVSGQPLDGLQVKALEDWLFREIAVRAGAHGLVVHIHTGNGDGPYFNNSRADPGLLESALNSKPLRNTKFVLLHGGWPYHLTTQAMLDKPNTYADFSAQTFYLTPHALAAVLRGWLAWHPEKILFGSDAYSDVNSPLSDYEEKVWVTTDRARRALAIALTGMMRDGEITRPRAIEIAQMVLNTNAAGLYRLK